MKKLLILSFLIFISLFIKTTLNVSYAQIDETSTYTVTLTSYFDSGNAPQTTLTGKPYGSSLAVNASLSSFEDYSFDFWIVNGLVRKNLPINHEFIITGDMDIIGVFSRTNEHAILFMDSNGKHIETVYTTNDGTVSPTVDVSSYTKPNFLSANTWDKPLTNITESDIRVLQYNINTTSEFSLNIIEGSVTTTPNGLNGKFIYNSVVSVQADTPRDGEKFSHWEIEGQIVSYNTEMNLSILEDTSVYAVFVKEDLAITETPSIGIRDVTLRANKYSYIAQMHIPTGHTLVDYGFLKSDTEVVNLTFDDIYRTRIEKYYGPTNEFLGTYDNTLKSIKAYLITEYNDTLHYSYSNQINNGFAGEGTIENPYQIASIADLNDIRNDLTAHYELTTDLDLTNYTYSDGSLGWLPIGDDIERFTGSFDGNDHYIKGLMINRPNTDNVGLFGHIGASDSSTPTTIKNTILIDVDIIGNRGTGSLVGRVTGNSNTLIEYSGVINGSVKGTGATGGLVGSNNSFTTVGAADRNPVISNSFSKVNVYGEYRDPSSRSFEKFGGLVGCSQKGTVKNSYSLSSVVITDTNNPVTRVGVLIGCNIYRGFLFNSYAAGTVTVSNASSTAIGALIGRTDSYLGNYSPIQDAYWNNELNGALDGIGKGEIKSGDIVLGLSTSNMQGSTSSSNLTELDFINIWETTTLYPILKGSVRFVDFQKYAQAINPSLPN